MTYEGFAAAWPTIEDEAGFAEKKPLRPAGSKTLGAGIALLTCEPTSR